MVEPSRNYLIAAISSNHPNGSVLKEKKSSVRTNVRSRKKNSSIPRTCDNKKGSRRSLSELLSDWFGLKIDTEASATATNTKTKRTVTNGESTVTDGDVKSTTSGTGRTHSILGLDFVSVTIGTHTQTVLVE